MLIAIDFVLAVLVLLIAVPVMFGVFVALALLSVVGWTAIGLYVCYSYLLRRMHVRRGGTRTRL